MRCDDHLHRKPQNRNRGSNRAIHRASRLWRRTIQIDRDSVTRDDQAKPDADRICSDAVVIQRRLRDPFTIGNFRDRLTRKALAMIKYGRDRCRDHGGTIPRYQIAETSFSKITGGELSTEIA